MEKLPLPCNCKGSLGSEWIWNGRVETNLPDEISVLVKWSPSLHCEMVRRDEAKG